MKIKKIEKIHAILSLVPNAQVVVEGDTVIWHDPAVAPVTDAEIDAELNRLKLDYNNQEYARNRVSEYPSIGDQLDALWKGGEAAEEMLAKVQAVKAKYPKPE